MVMFLKNLAIIGGLLFLMIFGSKIRDNVIMPTPIMDKPEDLDEE